MKIDVNSIALGVCIFCNKEVYNTDKKFVLALERPIYLNLWTHRTCYNGNNQEEAKKFLQVHLQEYLNKYQNQEFIDNGQKKTEKIKRRKPAVPKSERPNKSKTFRHRNSSISKV